MARSKAAEVVDTGKPQHGNHPRFSSECHVHGSEQHERIIIRGQEDADEAQESLKEGCGAVAGATNEGWRRR